MSLLKLSGIFAHELFARKKLQRSTERLKKLSTEKIAHATMNGGSILGRVAPGYLFQTVHITKTIAQCHNVLDIGCGTGEQLLQVATVCPNVNFTGIDHSDFILRKAQEQADKKGITNINFLKSHAESLKGISDNSYDGVISTMTLHHLANYNQLIQVFGEIKRILIPNGAIYLEDFTLFKSYKTINFFVDKDAPSPRDSFSELYEASMCAAILTSLPAGAVFFIDEIHRIPRDVEEYLYSAMEDFHIDIVTGEGLGARSMKFQLAPFTLVGATTRAGLLKAPFRDRFGIVEHMTFYEKEALSEILLRSARLLDVDLTEDGALEIARRSRGTPRIANRLLKRVRDYAEVKGDGKIEKKLAHYALDQLEVDDLGLDSMDRRILTLIHEKFAGGPVGIETLSAALSEEVDTLEEVYEPYLLKEGLIHKTPRGRVITEISKKHLDI